MYVSILDRFIQVMGGEAEDATRFACCEEGDSIIAPACRLYA
jgi:hypothetical protein